MKVMVGILMFPWLAIWRGWVLSILWGWFVVPQFHVAPLRIPIALGASAIAGMFTSVKENDKSNNLGFNIAVGITVPLITLAFGYLYHLFV